MSNKIIDYFPRGIVNSHFSLLPELRGADPISFAILEGKEMTGVSLMLLVEAMDEGPIIAFGKQPLKGNETSSELTKLLIALSAGLLESTLEPYVKGYPHPGSGQPIVPRSQEEVCAALNKPYLPTYTRKLTKQDGVIDWQKPAVVLEREVRAFTDWPKSRTTLGDIEVVILSADVYEKKDGVKPGSIKIQDKQLLVKTGEHYLRINSLKPAGKKAMPTAAFLAGYQSRLPAG